MVRDVCHDSQPAAMRHPHHHLADPIGRDVGEERLEHGNERVESFDGERLLPEERGALIALHGVDLGESLEQPQPFLNGELRLVRPQLDVLAQPDALLVAGKVLDLEGDRAAVRAAQIREHFGQVPTGHVHPQEVRGDLLHQLGRQAVCRRIHGRISDRRRPERIEMGTKVTVCAMRLDERGRGLHRAEQDAVGGGRRGRSGRRGLRQ